MQLGTSLIDTLRQSLETLTKAERQVAQIILNDVESATRLTLKELSQQANVSEPTVVRLARNVGCTGFSDLKQQLARDYAMARMFVYSEHDRPPSDAEAVMLQVYEAAAQALGQSFAKRDPAALTAAANILISAKRIFCFGLGGGSANSAQEAENRLFRYDLHVSAVVDSYRQRIAAGLCEADDCIMIFSATGRPPSLVECARAAIKLGASVIAIAPSGSPLAKASTVLIPVDIRDDQKQLLIPNRGRFAQLYIVDCIAAIIGSMRIEQSGPKLRQLRVALTSMNENDSDQQPIGD